MSASQSNESSHTESPSSAPNLPRGSACLPCRKRKMRCDGSKPFCGQCAAKNRPDDCEYTGDIQGLTRSQMLEENIAILEARIRELENPAESESVKLQVLAPHTSVSSGFRGTGSPEFVTGDVVSAHETGNNEPPYLYSSLTATESQEISAKIDAFLPYATNIGFFLHVPRFLSRVHTPPNEMNAQLNALISSVCLWGARLSRNPITSTNEQVFLFQAVQQVSTALFDSGSNLGARTQDMLYIIQSEVLLANYFFYNGRFLEGRYHCSAAVSLTISCRLNIIRTDLGESLSTPGTGQAMVFANMAQTAGYEPGLLSTEDTVSVGERINGFWTVYILDKTWAVTLGPIPSTGEAGPFGMKIDTPWPLTMEAYEKGEVLAEWRGYGTVEAFLGGIGVQIEDLKTSSSLAVHAKAAILFARASWLGTQYREGISDRERYKEEFHALDDYIAAFIRSLVKVESPNTGHDVGLELRVASMLARCALIQLHVNVAQNDLMTDERSRDSCMAAADAALAFVKDLDAKQVRYLDPIMAILMTAVAHVFLGEISRLNGNTQGRNDYLDSMLYKANRILGIMTDLGQVCPLMAFQAVQVEWARNSVLQA